MYHVKDAIYITVRENGIDLESAHYLTFPCASIIFQLSKHRLFTSFSSVCPPRLLSLIILTPRDSVLL